MSILKWSVGILAILNILLLVNTWRKPNHLPPPRFGEGGPAKMIIEELKFTPEQIQKFDKLKEAHQSAMRELKDKGKEIRTNYFDLLKQEQPDQKMADSLASSIAANQKAIEVVTFDHFKEVRKLCDDNQKKHFDEIIGDILKNMVRPEHGPPPHEPHP